MCLKKASAAVSRRLNSPLLYCNKKMHEINDNDRNLKNYLRAQSSYLIFLYR